MGVVWNYIRCMHISRGAIWTQKNFVCYNSWIKMVWYVVMRVWWNYCMRVCWIDWIIMIRIILLYIFSRRNHCNSFLRKYLVVTF